MATISNKVRYYTSEMVGAPVLSGTAGALIAVLDACLVNGFGNKAIDSLVVSGGVATAGLSSGHDFEPGDVLRVAGATPAGLNSDWRIGSVTATSVTWSVEGCGIADGAATGTITALRAPAGWEKVFSDGTTRAAYRSLNHADHNGLFFYVDDSGATTARTRGFESMTGIDGGSDGFPNDSQIAGGFWWPKSSAASTATRGWRMVADDRRITFAPRYLTGTNASTSPGLYFGLMSSRAGNNPWGTFIGGGTTEANALVNTPGSWAYNGLPCVRTSESDVSGYVARDIGGLVKSVVSRSMCLTTNSSSSSTGSTYYGATTDPQEIFSAPPVITKGGLDPVGMGVLPTMLHVCANLSDAAFPEGTKLGEVGNGSVVVWKANQVAAWMLSLGADGKYE